MTCGNCKDYMQKEYNPRTMEAKTNGRRGWWKCGLTGKNRKDDDTCEHCANKYENEETLNLWRNMCQAREKDRKVWLSEEKKRIRCEC